MEINKFSDIIGVLTKADIVEGRMVLLTGHDQSHDFGSREDLPGVKLPATAAEAAKATYLLVFAQDNRSLPILEPTPSYAYQLRSGWGVGADNVPITGSTVYLTHPGNMLGQTIPSGNVALAYAGGVYTLPSGAYVASANIQTVGNWFIAANTNDDGAGEAGKPKYEATKAGANGIVERYDSDTGNLQIRTYQP